MVFYRKYRPQTIEELDSSEVRDKLYSALKSSSVAHAFLFTGPKGLGKTSTARIVAKAVNCLQRQTINKEQLTKNKEQKGRKVFSSKFKVQSSEGIEPCNKCYQCASITNGSNVDVLEIDGASNRGIDEIRDLREKVRLSPAASKNKVYIIDEVHMLTQEAFNALLKTLEEPPSHVIFILCTTEPHKVPATIVSRCFHIAFKKATIEELVRSFKRIASVEKLKIDDETLKFIATLSDGSFRDGAKILEEMAVFNKKITKELVEEKYQIRQLPDQISEMIESLSKKDTKNGLQLVAKLVEQGVDMKYFIEQLISELHRMLLVRVGVNESPKLEVRSLKLEVEDIKELAELLSRAYGELRYAVLPQLPLELAIVEWSLVEQGSPHPLNDSSDPNLKQSINLARADASEHASQDSSFKSSFRGEAHPSSSPHAKAPRTLKEDEIWQALINKVKLYNHSIAGVLRGCGLKSYDKDKIVIETGYKFHKERLDEQKTRTIIEKVSREIVGEQVAVSVILKIKN